RRLAEDDVGYPFTPGKAYQTVAGPFGLEPDHSGAQFLSKGQILRELRGLFRPNPRRSFCRAFNIDCVPGSGEASGDSRAGAQQSLARGARRNTVHPFFGNRGRLQSCSLTILGGLGAYLIGNRPQRQFTQSREISLPEEIRECLLNLLRPVYLALSE